MYAAHQNSESAIPQEQLWDQVGAFRVLRGGGQELSKIMCLERENQNKTR